MSGDELVLAFVKAKKNPTTKQINSHWKSRGRGNTADNTLTKLVKEKKLKRTPVVGDGRDRFPQNHQRTPT